MRISHATFLLLSLTPTLVLAGSYTGTAVCSDTEDCAPASILSDPSNTVPPFAITHPKGYNGSGGVLQISICVLAGSEMFVTPASRAVATWNSLVPTTGNCQGCRVWEEGTASGSPTFHAETVLLHELGHCPLGLGHPDRNWDAQVPPDGIWEPTSYTRTVGVALPPAGIGVGPDFIPGSLDDSQSGAGSIPDNVHWFRIADNNPIAIDSTVIDINTFSPSVVLNLPTGHSWAANANRVVAESLGAINTQAVMYSMVSSGERKTDLTADDVNMVKMGMAGKDLLAGTADDYSVQLQFGGICNGTEDVIITFSDVPEGTAAYCETAADFSYSQNPLLARHMTGATTWRLFLDIPEPVSQLGRQWAGRRLLKRL